MDMIKYRLEFAKKYLDDAIDLFDKRRFNSSVSRAYYASYQAMWAALGDPEDGKIWRHLAIIKRFVRGYWFAPGHPKDGPGLLEDKRLPLRRLYAYRIKSDYDAEDISENVLEPLLGDVKQVIGFIERKGG
jgi:uncharacterized protein (UPF0332 family)